MLATRTTDLPVIRNSPHLFTWGKVIQIHDIGPYTLVEYTPRPTSGAILAGDSPAPNFHIYVDGNCTSVGAATLEQALLVAIARKHLEANEARWMAGAACKLLGIKLP